MFVRCVCLPVCMCYCVLLCKCVYICVCMCVYVYCTCVCVCLCVCVVCVCLCVLEGLVCGLSGPDSVLLCLFTDRRMFLKQTRAATSIQARWTAAISNDNDTSVLVWQLLPYR